MSHAPGQPADSLHFLRLPELLLTLPESVFGPARLGDILSGSHHLHGLAVITQVDPIAGLPRDFVVEWLSAPWEQSRSRSESTSLEARHAQLHRRDGVGDFPDSTVRCTAGPDFWQVATHLYERPKSYYRVRWRNPYTFTIVGISETPYPDCTVADSRGEIYPNLLDSEPRLERLRLSSLDSIEIDEALRMLERALALDPTFVSAAAFAAIRKGVAPPRSTKPSLSTGF